MDKISNLIAFLIPMAIFFFWLIPGYAALALLRSQRTTIQNLLLAPVVGFSITVLLVFQFNRIGLPVEHFALIMSFTLLAVSLIILRRKKTLFPFNHYLPYLLIITFGSCVIGYPLLKYGFNWLSFGNDDMTNYALGAAHFVKHGFFEIPNLQDFTNKKDYSILYWFWYVVGMIRPGSELMLSWLSSITYLNPAQIFMPLIIAFYLTLVSATGALVYSSQKKHISLITCLMLSLSALTALGVYYQLIGQVSGLPLLIAGLILTCQPFVKDNKFNVIKQSILIGIILSALAIVYPELLPFLVLPIIIYFSILIVKGWRPNNKFFLIILGSFLFIIMLLNVYIIAIIEFFVREYQINSNAVVMQTSLFPYFLLPSGIANLWGFIGITFHKSIVYTNFAIISGIILTCFIIVYAIRLTVKNLAIPAIVTLVMFFLAADFFQKKFGFGLFKLSMYIQPFLISVLVISTFEVISNNFIRKIFLFTIILGGCFGLIFYEKLALSRNPGSFIEIAYGSSNKLTGEYKKLISRLPDDALLLSDEFNISIIRIQALESLNKKFIPLTSPSNFLIGALEDNIYLFPSIHRTLFYGETARKIIDIYSKKSFVWGDFDLYDNNLKMHFLEHKYCFSQKPCEGYLINDNAIRSIFNRRYTSEDTTKDFSLQKLSDVKNHLVFIDSDLGESYHSMIANKMDHLSLFNLENDYFYPGKSFQTVGRFLLMQILNPSSKFRVEVALTSSLNNDGKNKIPNVVAVGERRIPIPTMGRGSARIISLPFSSQPINNNSFIALDMHANRELSFNPKKKGMMNLYNSDIVEDSRKVTTYVRDISLLSENDYLNLNPPSFIQNFPKDLANKDLEYSGIYEDGWFSEDVYVKLKQLNNHKTLMIKGEMPNTSDEVIKSTLTLLLDGKVISRAKLVAGTFNLAIPLTSNSSLHKIELHFDKSQKLQGADKRPVGAKINFLGFV